MALSNIAGWAEENKTAAACGTACGASDKPAETPAACGAADKPAETPAACGAADKPAEAPAACGAADKPEEKPAACGTACLNYGEAYAPDEIINRSICINGDIREILMKL